MGPDSQGKPFAILFACVAASLLLVVIGFVLHRRGALTNRITALVWAILCIVPLFGAGAVMFLRHQVQFATGETQSRHSEDKVLQNQPAH